MSEIDNLKKQWERQDRESIDSAISALLQHEQGKKFLWWLLEIGRVGGQPFTANSLHTAFNCGELNVGQRILDRVISVSPEGYVSMMKENEIGRRTRDDAIALARDRAAGADRYDADSDG
jgi:hypothetical protein